MELKFMNTKNELMEYYYYFLNHQTTIRKYRKYKIFGALPIGIFVSIVVLVFRFELMKIHGAVYPEDVLYILLPILIALIWSVVGCLLSNVMKKDRFETLIKNQNIVVDEDIELKITGQGIEYNRKDTEVVYYWNFIKKVVENNGCLYIIFVDGDGIVIPLEVFSEDLTKESIIDAIESNIA